VTNGIQDVALAFEPNEGDVLQRKPRSPRERIFNQLMIERTAIAAVLMGVIGFLTFRWFVPEGASDTEVASARNALLLLMVLFENIHIGNCRSETKSALRFSPLHQVGTAILAAAKSDPPSRCDRCFRDSSGRDVHADWPDDAGNGAGRTKELGHIVPVGTPDLSGNGTTQMDLEHPASGACLA
jgi:hypothetical protein